MLESYLLHRETHRDAEKCTLLSIPHCKVLHYTSPHLGGSEQQHLRVHLVKELSGKVHLRTLVGLPVLVFVAPEQAIPFICATETNIKITNKRLRKL